jgi:hypothetical protein
MKLRFFLLFIPVLIISGCGQSSVNEDLLNPEIQAQLDKEMKVMLTKLDHKKMTLICEQEEIPSEFASECYFRERKICESMSGLVVKKAELEKCAPIFLKELVENLNK